MTISIPDSVCDEILKSHFLLQNRGYENIESITRQVELIEYQVGQILTGIIIKELTKH